MKRIIKIKSGEVIPDGAKHVRSVQEPDPSRSYQRWEQTEGIKGMIPIFGTETLYQYTPISTFHYYEIEELLYQLNKS